MKTKNIIIFGILFLILAVSVDLTAQTAVAKKTVKVLVKPAHADWNYMPGETARFEVTVLKDSLPLLNVEVRYELSQDMKPAFKKETRTLENGVLSINAGTLKEPGFLRCRIYAKYEGKEYSGMATVAYDTKSIKASTRRPADFQQFWDQAKADAAKIPMDVRMVLLPERCTGKVNVYHVSVQNYQMGARLYGMLCVPVAEGKYPALLELPGAGVRAYKGDLQNAEKGVITFQIGVHGIPVNLPAEVYDNLSKGALKGYPAFNLEDKDEYYYKRVYLGCLRAVDLIYSLPQFDGSNLIVYGGSQGGALSMVTAALDSRVKGLVAFFPAMCNLSEMTKYINNTELDLSLMFNHPIKITPDKLETTNYYDVVNFVPQIKVPGFYSFGYNDLICSPFSIFSAYNVVTAPKELFIVKETGHYTVPKQTQAAWTWMYHLIM
ncbi:MAG: acetylxylan esterase [Bacteroidales bacterium]|nr:acetylxylan esterase [Bacteroidales bacterium]